MTNLTPFYIKKGSISAIPVLHYKMEMAAIVKLCIDEIKPDCIAVELPESMSLQFFHAASRLPDISLVLTYDKLGSPLYFMSEPCDPAFEGLRSAQEKNIPSFCIDLDVDGYPDIFEPMPDCYSLHKIGLHAYYEAYKRQKNTLPTKTPLDIKRETYMAKRLKELSFSYDNILFIGGMSHIENVLELIDQSSFKITPAVKRDSIQLVTLTEKSTQEVLAEYGWISEYYEMARTDYIAGIEADFPPDRQKLLYSLYKESAENYTKETGNNFAAYNLKNLMKFSRNYALITNQLTPSLYQLITAAKNCVDHNFAYEVWHLATTYTHRRNIDGLAELELSIEDIWGSSKVIRFHLKDKSKKNFYQQKKTRKDRLQYQFHPPGMFSICSYPPEDIAIEKFGNFLKKKGTQLLKEESAKILPFSTSIEDGIDTKETIRHWHEKKLYVKTTGKPPGAVGSVVIIFDEGDLSEKSKDKEKYSWCTTWIGEHAQESDMSFYATPLANNIVGPGISRCEYGGFFMSYPPRRLYDIWQDPDYADCLSKAEVLLMAAIDYAIQPLIVYVASKPPKSLLKSYARRYGKKVVYIPIGQLSPVTLNKLRIFHVLDGQNKREIAGDYIF